jgi:hypothetical protein
MKAATSVTRPARRLSPDPPGRPQGVPRTPPGHAWLLRAALVLALAATVQVGTAGPASAHAVGIGPAASNYRTNVRGIEPPIPGVSVRVVDGGNQLELTNRGSQEITLLGYENEPYLRVGPNGVFENERSPSTFSNRSTTAPRQIPAGFSASARPDWRRISSQPVAIFHDHRAHWSGRADPAAVRRARGTRQTVTPDWQVPIRVGDKLSILSGSIEWVPGPSPWPWAAVAVALAAFVLLVSRGGWESGALRSEAQTEARRGQAKPSVGPPVSWQAKALAGVTALAVVTDAVHTFGVWTGSTAPIVTQLYGSATSFAGWVIAAIAIQRLLTGKLEAGRTFVMLAAIFLALAGAAPDVPALARSQLPSGLDPLLTRAAISATLGLGAGMLLAALLGRQLRTPRLAGGGAAAASGRRPHPVAARRQGASGSSNRPRGQGGSRKRSRKSGER